MKGFKQREDLSELSFLPIDIETTGFSAIHDQTTTITLLHDGQYHQWVNTDGGAVDVSALKTDVTAHSELDVMVYASETEAEMFNSVERFLDQNTDQETTVLVAYNGEKYKGGFDLPFLRTRGVLTGAGFPLAGYYYTDAIEVFSDRNRLDTTVPGVPSKHGNRKAVFTSMAEHCGIDAEGNKDEVYDRLVDADIPAEMLQEWAHEHNDGDVPTNSLGTLDEVHEVLVEQNSNLPALTDKFGVSFEPVGYDPFEDSSEAVDAYHDEEYCNLLLHNLADVAKTQNLTTLMLATAPKKDYRPKRLQTGLPTPTDD